MTTPLLTIGLPVYNARPYLEDALRSILAQTFQDWELIAYDDGSTDGSGEYLARVRDPRVRVLGEKANRGLATGLNLIHAEARGRYIARMDADDLMHPERLARQVAFLESRGEVDVVGTGLVSVGRELEPRGARIFPGEHEAITQGPVAAPQMGHAMVMGRTPWWRRFHYNEANRGCEDLELWLASRDSSRFANLPGLFYYYREYSSFSLSKYVHNKAHEAALSWRSRKARVLPATLEVAGHVARAGAYTLASALRMQDKLIARRSAPLTSEQYEECVAAIAQVRATALPVS